MVPLKPMHCCLGLSSKALLKVCWPASSGLSLHMGVSENAIYLLFYGILLGKIMINHRILESLLFSDKPIYLGVHLKLGGSGSTVFGDNAGTCKSRGPQDAVPKKGHLWTCQW